jgi:phosphoribosylamine--glycine ligase
MKEEDMGFLIISEGGDGLGLAIRLQQEGHKTSMYIRDSLAEQRGEGLVAKGEVPEFNPIYLADCTGAGSLLDSYRDTDRRTFGGSQIADNLECDRTFSSRIFNECGIRQPYSETFNNWDEAEEFLNGNDTKYVFKPEGKLSGNLPSYVPNDNDELIGMFEQFKGIIGPNEPEFVLQEFISGTCISSEIWAAKGKIIKPTNHTLERKQFLNEDLGPSGGCTGNVVWRCNDINCQLCENLYKLEGFLEETQWTGPIDINTVVSKEGKEYALEFTPRFGYDAFPTLLLGLFDGDFGSFIHSCCRGDNGDQPLKDGFAAGVRVSLPPWPSEEFHGKANVQLRGLRESDFDRFYPYEVGLQKDSFVSSGGVGIIGVCVGYGRDFEEAFEEAYKMVWKLEVPDLQYRTDFVEIFKKDLMMLRRAYDVEFART